MPKKATIEAQELPVEVKPEPKPGEKGFDWAAEYGTDDVYIHTFADGTVVGLSSFGSIFSKTWLYKIRHLSTDIDIQNASIDRGSCPTATQVLESLDADGDADPIQELWDGWTGKATSNGGGEGVDGGKLIWLVAKATGDLADAIDRDLFSDGRDFDELGWRGLWAYINTAPPGTAIHHALAEGWAKEAKLLAETLNGIRALLWRYTAVHFVGGAETDFPEPIEYPGTQKPVPQKSWETVTLDEMVSPEVRAFLKGA